MGSEERIKAGELVEDIDDFFAPMASDLVDSLVGEYDATRKRLENMASSVSSEACRGVLHYFVEGNVQEQRHSMPTTVEALFNLPGAVGQLNADFWNRALRMTDVLDYMPQKRRDEWFEQIRNPLGRKPGRHSNEAELAPLPEFEESTVRATLAALLNSRTKFFGERVDGIFRSLSREHVTNCPQGFNKRMILLRAITHYDTIDHSTAGVINDLRCVIAKFMGRDEPKYGATDAVITAARKHNGVWMGIDGNAMRIRIYNGVGTAHLEVHPEMAWRLNSVLASMYPAAIPAEFRTKPKRAKKIKDFELFDKPLPFAVVELLARLEPAKRKVEVQFRDYYENIPRPRRFQYGEHDKAAMAQAEKVLESIGAVREKSGHYEFWRFDYEPADILDQIVCSGCIPDHKSHQFYPTPASVAEKAIELAGIQSGHTCLEPSAGQGGLADLMPRDDTTCIEISELHCKILEAKGHKVVEADFLKVAGLGRFDRIVMNPPFSEGRWQAHLQHAAGLLSDDGRLVAILPSSAKGKDLLPGFTHEWSPSYANEFAGTSVSVVILAAQRELN
ncbi:MAG TPA: restriction endonuclease subunit M [Pseudomonas sp.]|nr:restriction endonuclease subunit M [Pseudomonas sp.]